MALTVLSVAFPFARVAPDAVGGAEQVLGRLDAALVRSGHQSIVVASSDSTVEGKLVPTRVPQAPLNDEEKRRVWSAHRDNIVRTMRDFEVDAVHMHGVDFLDYLPPPGDVPILVTLHLPPTWYPARAFALARDDVYLHCVSHHQHRQCPRSARLLAPICNGVTVRDKAPDVRRRDFALALGRICAEKNWHTALDAGRLAGVPVLLAGSVFAYDAHRAYYESQIVPRLDGSRRFIGAVDPRTRHRLLSRARCLLVPSLAPETSSLAAMEALACGTPVVAYPNGALPEIVEDGVTGFLVRSPEEMAKAIRRCADIPRSPCHAVARERFDAAKMIDQYFDVYRRLAARTAVHA